MYKLFATCQNYHWGKPGSTSAVADLYKLNSKVEIENDQHYAELWMGGHPKSSSKLSKNGTPATQLSDLYAKMPFLLKVLSVDTALSIQAHPNKSHAEKLHAERPEIYKDPNHKPEMCIAVTEFEGLCGFRKFEEITSFLDRVKGLSEVCKIQKIDSKEDLKLAFKNLMEGDKDVITEKLAADKVAIEASNDESLLPALFSRLYSQYPGDVGIYCIYFLNLVTLKKGECMFLSANVPHAYLKGDCIECMAKSDNVVRAGLTPKLRDVGTLVEMLDYTPSTADERKFQAKTASAVDTNGQESLILSNFITSLPDFLVQKIEPVAKEANGSFSPTPLENVDGEAIYLCTQGSCKIAKSKKSEENPILTGCDVVESIERGSVTFTPANYGTVEVSEASDDLILWRATRNYFL